VEALAGEELSLEVARLELIVRVLARVAAYERRREQW
jgi:hypothetical protein